MGDKFQLKALITGVDKLSPMLGTIRKNAMGLRKQLNSTGLGKITFMEALQGGAIAAPFVMGVKAAIGFESAMADVKKVVNFDTPQQFKDMSQDVRNLSKELPMSAEGIAAIVAAGGQSGIAREELNAFAQDAVKMGIAFDTTAEESGSMMAKWRTAFKLNQTEVVVLADKINELGNTGAASVGQISKIVTAIGPLGEIAGLNAGQIAAMASSLAGVGIAEDVAATGMKNFALTLTAGTAATKSQKQAFKALRLDSAAIAKGMSVDSEGTINKVLKSIGKVEKSKQAAVLTQLFGKESVGAIAPLLTNLDTLQKNFGLVNDQTKFGGSMQREYASRAATTANAMQLMQNRVTDLGISVGTALLPPLNDFLEAIGPIVSQISTVVSANPALIKAIVGAAAGFAVLRLAVITATFAMTMFDNVTKKSIVGIVVRGLAMAAGMLIANWSSVAPFFQAVWEKIQGPAMALWAWLKNAFTYTPLAQVIENWGPLTEFFAATWELVQALSVPFFDFMKSAFDFSPLGLIIKHWEPITAWFQGLWDTIKPIIEPILKFMGGGEGGPGIIKTATNKAKSWAEEQRERNAGAGGGTGAFVQADAVDQAINAQAARNASMGGLDAKSLLRAPGAPSINQQAAANQRNNLEGSFLIKMEGAPPGTRVEGSTNQPGLKVDSQLGTRTLSR